MDPAADVAEETNFDVASVGGYCERQRGNLRRFKLAKIAS